MKTEYFIIDKKNGDIWDCQPHDHNGQMQNISGIGVSSSDTYGELSEFFINTFSKYNQIKFTGEMIFLTDEKYEDFIKFISSKNLTIKRVSSNTKTLYLDVKLSAFSRNESTIKDVPVIFCDIDFDSLTPWYKIPYMYRYFAASAESTKQYNYKYPYKYASAGTANFTIKNTSNSDMIGTLTISGAANKPTWRCYNDNDPTTVLLSGRYNDFIATGEKLVIESRPNNLSVNLINARGESKNVFAKCDLSLQTFLYFPRGINRVIVRDSEEHSPDMTLEVIEIARIP